MPAALLTLALAASLQLGSGHGSASTTFRVAPDGDFTTIGEAVRAASPGDSVIVAT